MLVQGKQIIATRVHRHLAHLVGMEDGSESTRWLDVVSCYYGWPWSWPRRAISACLSCDPLLRHRRWAESDSGSPEALGMTAGALQLVLKTRLTSVAVRSDTLYCILGRLQGVHVKAHECRVPRERCGRAREASGKAYPSMLIVEPYSQIHHRRSVEVLHVVIQSLF